VYLSHSLCSSLKKEESLSRCYLSTSARIFLRASTFRRWRLAEWLSSILGEKMRWCIFHRRAINVAWKSDGEKREYRYWCDRRGDLSVVRSIFDTSGQKPHNCGCNIDDVSPDNGVNVHLSVPLPLLSPLSCSFRGRENLLASITIIIGLHRSRRRFCLNRYFRANLCRPAW